MATPKIPGTNTEDLLLDIIDGQKEIVNELRGIRSKMPASQKPECKDNSSLRCLKEPGGQRP